MSFNLSRLREIAVPRSEKAKQRAKLRKMNPTLEKSMQRAWCEYKGVEYVEDYVNPLPSDNFDKGYNLGHRDAVASQWRDTKKELPYDGELILIWTPDGIELASFDGSYQSWLDSDGDKLLYANKDDVALWMRIPDVPKTY